MTAESIITNSFVSEFHPIVDKFVILTHHLSELEAAQHEYIWNPGVYIYHRNGTVLKVGRNLTNSKKRALEHVGATTGKKMQIMDTSADVYVTQINVKDPNDRHWTAALEIYLEQKLEPHVKSGRLG